MMFELEKLLKNKIIWITIVASVLITIYFSFNHFRYVKEIDDKELSVYEGVYTEDLGNQIKTKYDQICEEYNQKKSRHAIEKVKGENFRTADTQQKQESNKQEASEVEIAEQKFFQWSTIGSKVEICRRVIDYRQKVVKNARHLQFSQTGYKRTLGKCIESLYARKVILVIKNEILSGRISEKWNSIEYADYVNILCVIIVVCVLYLNEHTNHTYAMIYSSVYGRGKNYRQKLLSISIIISLLAILTTVLQLAGAMTHKDFISIMKMDIQNVADYIHSPFSMKLWQLWLLIALLRIEGYLCIAVIMIFLTQFFQKNIVPFCVGSVLFLGGCVVMNHLLLRIQRLQLVSANYSKEKAQLALFERYTPFGIIREAGGFLKEYETHNLFGYPIMNITITVVINFIYILVFSIGGYLVYLKRFRRKG